MSSSTATTTTTNTASNTMAPSFLHTTISMENMVHTTRDLTCTDSADDIPLNPDGTLPTPAEKALDILNNTTVETVYNRETNAYELLTTRHAPFGMPLSEQYGELWWIAPDTSPIDAEIEEAMVNLDGAMADLAEAVIEESTMVDAMIEESMMADAEQAVADLTVVVGLELELGALELEQERVLQQIRVQQIRALVVQPTRRRHNRRERRDSGVDCEFLSSCSGQVFLVLVADGLL